MSAPFHYFLNSEAQSKGIELGVPRELDAGFDLPSLDPIVIEPGAFVLLRTGVHLAVPEGWVGLVRDRSSVALKGGVTVAGVIDASYRGEVKVAFYNFSKEPLTFQVGERIAQIIIVPHLAGSQCTRVELLDGLGDTVRGAGGFGSTGK